MRSPLQGLGLVSPDTSPHERAESEQEITPLFWLAIATYYLSTIKQHTFGWQWWWGWICRLCLRENCLVLNPIIQWRRLWFVMNCFYLSIVNTWCLHRKHDKGMGIASFWRKKRYKRGLACSVLPEFLEIRKFLYNLLRYTLILRISWLLPFTRCLPLFTVCVEAMKEFS